MVVDRLNDERLNESSHEEGYNSFADLATAVSKLNSGTS